MMSQTPFLGPEVCAEGAFAPLYHGDYSVKIADSRAEVEAAQRLRHQVFYASEPAAPPVSGPGSGKRDHDRFDAVCDHLLVRYHGSGEERLPAPQIVGTYRLLRDSEMRATTGRFYSEDEYDIEPIKAYDGRVMELGRSCTHPDFRTKTAMQLLWRGIGEYVMHHRIDLMFGCASFPRADPDTHVHALSYLYHYHLAPEAIRPCTLPDYYVEMARLPAEALDAKRVFFRLPVLVKGYLRLGGVVGEGAYLDHAMGTTDVLMVVETHRVDARYVAKYAPDSVSAGDGDRHEH